jgi:hypothetical protein
VLLQRDGIGLSSIMLLLFSIHNPFKMWNCDNRDVMAGLMKVLGKIFDTDKEFHIIKFEFY